MDVEVAVDSDVVAVDVDAGMDVVANVEVCVVDVVITEVDAVVLEVLVKGIVEVLRVEEMTGIFTVCVLNSAYATKTITSVTMKMLASSFMVV